jgi:hypothetical protein
MEGGELVQSTIYVYTYIYTHIYAYIHMYIHRFITTEFPGFNSMY